MDSDLASKGSLFRRRVLVDVLQLVPRVQVSYHIQSSWRVRRQAPSFHLEQLPALDQLLLEPWALHEGRVEAREGVLDLQELRLDRSGPYHDAGVQRLKSLGGEAREFIIGDWHRHI